MGFVESVGDLLNKFWRFIVKNSVLFVLLSSIATLFLGLFLVAGGGYVLGTFKTSSELIATSIAMAVGSVILVLSLFGCVAVVTRKPKLILFYSVLCALLFLAEFIFACYLLSLVYAINAVNDAEFTQQLTSELDKNANDYIYSMYTTCCTGCTAAVCGANTTSPDSTGYCIQDDPLFIPCEYVSLCPTLNSTAVPSTESCFFNKSKQGSLPTFRVGEDVCALLKTAPWGAFAKPIVGSPGGDINEGRSCGGGDPKEFALSITDWVNKNHQWFGAVLTIIMIVEIWVTLCSYALYQRRVVELASILPKDPKRPWVDRDNVMTSRPF